MALIRRASHAGSWYTDIGKETLQKYLVYPLTLARTSITLIFLFLRAMKEAKTLLFNQYTHIDCVWLSLHKPNIKPRNVVS